MLSHLFVREYRKNYDHSLLLERNTIGWEFMKGLGDEKPSHAKLYLNNRMRRDFT